MNNTFYTLSDDCMLMYEKNIFIVEKIKEHLLNGLNQKMQFLFDGGSRNSYHKSFFTS